MLESRIEAAACKWARSAGWLTIKVGHSGFPDRIFIREGCHVWIEFKQPGGRLSPLQRTRISQLMRENVPVYVCRSKNEVKKCLSEIIRKKQLASQ